LISIVALVNLEKKQKKKRPLKRATTGFEIEAHVINDDGSLSYKGFDLVKKLNKKYPKMDVVKECGKNMIEFGCYPDINAYNPALHMVKTLRRAVKLAKKHKLRLYPFSTYPGKVDVQFTPSVDGKYEIQEKIFGKEKFGLAVKAIGFHHHHAFPKGVFDFEKKDLKLMIDSKLKRSLLNSYNFEIAIDPAITLLAQSSPFFEGKHFAKDSRILIYRGGKKLGYNGLYNKVQQVGGLPPYKQTGTDLIRSLKRRTQRWRRLVKKANPDADFDKMYPYKLDISWNPVKINKHGTIEQRGMDMNYMSVMLGLSALIKFCLKKIQHDFIEVLPSDIGMNQPFKITNGILYVPPHTYVREKLQRASAYEGYDNEVLYNYAKRFYRFAKSLTPKYYHPLLKKIDAMMRKKRSLSDEMLTYARRRKLLNAKGEICDRNSAILATHFADKFEEDLEETYKIVKNIMAKNKEVKE